MRLGWAVLAAAGPARHHKTIELAGAGGGWCWLWLCSHNCRKPLQAATGYSRTAAAVLSFPTVSIYTKWGPSLLAAESHPSIMIFIMLVSQFHVYLLCLGGPLAYCLNCQ